MTLDATPIGPPVTGRTGTLYTFGHSTVTPDGIVALLADVSVTAVADVRSHPTSRHHDHAELVAAFEQAGIVYVPMGNQLGGRPADPALYTDDGRVDYAAVRRQIWFEAGLLRLDAAIDKGYTVALMCSEDDPVTCHRHLLVAPALTARGYTVTHLRHRPDDATQDAMFTVAATRSAQPARHR